MMGYTMAPEDLLASLLDAIGALSNPSELDGLGLPEEERKELEGFIQTYASVRERSER